MKIILMGKEAIHTYDVAEGIGNYTIPVPAGFRIRGGLESASDGVLVFRIEREVNQIDGESGDVELRSPMSLRMGR